MITVMTGSVRIEESPSNDYSVAYYSVVLSNNNLSDTMFMVMHQSASWCGIERFSISCVK